MQYVNVSIDILKELDENVDSGNISFIKDIM